MANKNKTVYLRGKIYWAKIFGDPRPNYAKDGREWTFEFEPESEEAVKNAGLMDKMKDKSEKKGYEGRKPFMTLKRKEFKFNGDPQEHIRVVDAENQPWPENTLIGNESVVDVKINIVEYPGKNDGVYANAIRVLELVPYQSSDFEPIDKGDKYYRKPKEKAEDTFAKDFGLDDDVPVE